MPILPEIGSPSLLVTGLAMIVLGLLLHAWASRHNLIEVATGAALSTAWTTLIRRRRPDVPEEIRTRVADVVAEQSNLGRATKVAGYAARHAVAQVVGLIGILFVVLGLLAGILGVFWR